MKKIRIGVTDCSKYEKYASWISSHSHDIEIVKLSEKLNNIQDVKECAGVLFTGGEDVDPGFYGNPEYIGYCIQQDMNVARDRFELELMQYTEENKIPVLGICRGLQLFNVFLGGTLIPDIPTWEKPSHGKLENGEDRYHEVKVIKGSWMSRLIGEEAGEVNSNHHQSADKVGQGLKATVFTEDGIVEALEREQSEGKSFLCLVQWHPERMANQGSNFVQKIREAFINAARNNSK